MPSEERIARANGIEIAYDTFGDPGDPTLLLVMGLGVQLTGWDPVLCEELAGRGFQVVRFDNRDVGHSTKIKTDKRPNLMASMGRSAAGLPIDAPYKLRDMAGDAAGLIDALGVGSAHVMGASLGGMVAQTLAIGHPEKVRSLTSIMSTTGGRFIGMPSFRALGTLLRAAPPEREAYAEHMVGVFKIIGSPSFPVDEERIRDRALASYDRCRYPAGILRQLLAVMSSRDRTNRLRELDVPTLILHGDKDPLIPLRAGKATAAAIPGAELEVIKGMGHDLPRQIFPRLADAVEKVARRGEDRLAARRTPAKAA